MKIVRLCCQSTWAMHCLLLNVFRMAFRFINKQTNWASSIPHFQCTSPLGDSHKKLQYTANDLVGMAFT